MRQKDIFDPVNQKYKIVVLGAGSLGSFITLNLAKLGFNDLEVYDFDLVEEHNIGNQFYRISDIGKSKVESLKEMVKDFTGIDIIPHNEKVNLQTKMPLNPNTLYILTFDTLESRKMFYELIKNYKCTVLDVRVGGEEFNIRVTDTFNSVQLKEWEESFNITPTQLPCGARSIIYTNLAVASETCNIVKKLNNNESYPTKLIRHMKGYLFIQNQNKK